MSSNPAAAATSFDAETKAILARLDEITKIHSQLRETISKSTGQAQLDEISRYNNLTSEQTALIQKLNGIRSVNIPASIVPTTAVRSATPNKTVVYVNQPQIFSQAVPQKTYISGPIGAGPQVYFPPQTGIPNLVNSIAVPSSSSVSRVIDNKSSLPLNATPKIYEAPRVAPFKSSVMSQEPGKPGMTSSFMTEGLKSSVIMLEKPTHGENVIKIKPKDVLKIAERPQTASLKTSLYDPILNSEIATGNGAVTYKLIRNPLEADAGATQIRPDLEYGKFESGQNIGVGSAAPQIVYVAVEETYSSQQISNLQPFWNGQKIEHEKSEEETLREMVQSLAWRITPGIMKEKLQEICPMCYSIAKLYPDFRPNCSAISDWAFKNLDEAFKYIKLSYGGQLPDFLLQKEGEVKAQANGNASEAAAGKMYMATAKPGEPMAQGEILIKNIPGGFKEVGEHEHVSSKKHLVIMDVQDEFDDDCEACREERALLEKLGKLPPKKQPSEPTTAAV